MRALAVLAGLMLIVTSGLRGEETPAGGGDAPALAPNEYHGALGCSKCAYGDKAGTGECVAALKTADGVYLLKPAHTAPPAIRSFLDRIRDGQLTGEYLCRGEVSEVDGTKWLAVASMVARPLPKASTATPVAFGSGRRSSTANAGGNRAGDNGNGPLDEGGGGTRRGGGRSHGGHRHGGDAGGDTGGDGGGMDEQ